MDKKGGGKGKCKGGDEWQQHGSLAFLVLMLFTTLCTRQRLWVDYQNYLANHQHQQNPYQTLADAFQMVNDNVCRTTAQSHALRNLHGEMHELAERVLGFCNPPIRPLPRVVAAPGATRSVAQVVADDPPAVQAAVPPPPPLSAPSSLPRMAPPPQDSPSVPHGSSSKSAPAKDAPNAPSTAVASSSDQIGRPKKAPQRQEARNPAAENLARIGEDLNKRSNWIREGPSSASANTAEPDSAAFEDVAIETEAPSESTVPPNAVLINSDDAESSLKAELMSVDKQLEVLRAQTAPGTTGETVAAEVPEPGSSMAEEKPVATDTATTHPAPETTATHPAPETTATQSAPEVAATQSAPEVAATQSAPEPAATQSAPETGATHRAPEVAATPPAPETTATHRAPREAATPPGPTRGGTQTRGRASQTGGFARRNNHRSRSRRGRSRYRSRSRRNRSRRSRRGRSRTRSRQGRQAFEAWQRRVAGRRHD